MKKDKFEIIKGMNSIKQTDMNFLDTSSYRNMLDNIHKGCYIESESTNQHGTVVDIIKNKYKIPVCIKVLYKNEEDWKTYYDYISVDRISFYEPYDFYVSNDEYDDDEN